ncbi:MAG: LysE family translocator [Paludibacteraceae bacterium]
MILDTLLVKGIIIGLSISIPLGPIGMLCIQRTLNRGQKYGLATGVGATFSDLVYSVVTMFFLNFILMFIEQHQFVIQIIGSIIILFFGMWIYRSNPSSQPLPNEKSTEHSLIGDFFSSFALTLTNPLILFILIALFAQFDFVSTEMTLLEHAFALFSILLGASIWWITLTSLVSRFRHKLNIRGLKFINRLTGGIITIIGVGELIFTLIKH